MNGFASGTLLPLAICLNVQLSTKLYFDGDEHGHDGYQLHLDLPREGVLNAKTAVWKRRAKVAKAKYSICCSIISNYIIGFI